MCKKLETRLKKRLKQVLAKCQSVYKCLMRELLKKNVQESAHANLTSVAASLLILVAHKKKMKENETHIHTNKRKRQRKKMKRQQSATVWSSAL